MANIASVAAAFTRLGVACRFIDTAAEASTAHALVLPGVGSFGPGMRFLTEHGFDHVIRDRIATDRPTLAVCLGFQLLCRTSTEGTVADAGASSSKGVVRIAGLDILPVDIERFDDSVDIPQLGWNRVFFAEMNGRSASLNAASKGQIMADTRIGSDGFAYFANSYRASLSAANVEGALAAAGWLTMTADHGGRFIAAVERGAVLACQFHPELSGAFGLELLSRWCERAGIPLRTQNVYNAANQSSPIAARATPPQTRGTAPEKSPC